MGTIRRKKKKKMHDQSPITKGYLNGRLDGVVTSIRGEIRGVLRHFNQSQAEQNKRLDRLEHNVGLMKNQLSEISEELGKVKLVVMDYIGTGRVVHNLVRELKGQGIKLNEQKIFAL